MYTHLLFESQSVKQANNVEEDGTEISLYWLLSVLFSSHYCSLPLPLQLLVLPFFVLTVGRFSTTFLLFESEVVGTESGACLEGERLRG